MTLLMTMIVFLGLGLRLYNLDQRGLIEHDEGGIILASQLYTRAGLWFANNLQNLQEGKVNFGDLRRSLIVEGGGTQNMTAKPIQYLITSGFLWVGGFSDASALASQSLLGALTVLFVFSLGKKIYNFQIGLFASLVLAVSAYHIYYSRSIFSQSTSAFFALLGIYAFYQSSLPTKHHSLYLALAGLTVGISFASHYNLFWEFALLLIYEIWIQFRKRILNVRRLIILSASMAAPLLAIEAAFRLVSFAIGKYPQANISGFRFRTYFEQIYDQTLAASKYAGTPDIVFFPGIFWTREGILVTLLIGIGFGLVAYRLFKEKGLADLIVLSQFLVPLTMWSLSSLQYPRNLVVALPFAALIAANGIAMVVDRIPMLYRHRTVALTVTAIAILLTGLFNSLPIVLGTSGYRAAANALRQYAQAHPGTVVAKAELGLLTDPLWRFYLGNLVDYDNARGTVFIIDRTAYGQGSGNSVSLLFETKCAQQIISEPNDLHWYMTGDSPTNPPEEEIRKIPEANLIRIYDRRLELDVCH